MSVVIKMQPKFAVFLTSATFEVTTRTRAQISELSLYYYRPPDAVIWSCRENNIWPGLQIAERRLLCEYQPHEGLQQTLIRLLLKWRWVWPLGVGGGDRNATHLWRAWNKKPNAKWKRFSRIFNVCSDWFCKWCRYIVFNFQQLLFPVHDMLLSVTGAAPAGDPVIAIDCPS